MKTITILSKTTCGPCQALKQFIKTLPENKQKMFTIIDDTTINMNKLIDMVKSYDSNGFPTIILKDNGKEEVIIGLNLPKIKEFIA
jgi:glutaredoxin